MNRRLSCASFHSVKGGVGKSTLAVLTAGVQAERAASSHGLPVVLLDMDLTGTSLADVLPLCAPKWPMVGPEEPIDLLSARGADAYCGPEETGDRIEVRRDQAVTGTSSTPPDRRRSAPPRGVPFLNDYLLYATQDWRAERDAPVDAFLWKVADGPPCLFVIPSSALPQDLERMLPLIYDEERAGFLEGRLERLIAGLLEHLGSFSLVIDTPPTIPGLSRSVLSLALRLGREPKTPLAEGGSLPQALEDTRILWAAHLVASPDIQDLRAIERWLNLVREDEQEVISCIINRHELFEPGDRSRLLDRAFAHSANSLARNARWVADDRRFRLFRDRELGDGGDIPFWSLLSQRLRSPAGQGTDGSIGSLVPGGE